MANLKNYSKQTKVSEGKNENTSVSLNDFRIETAPEIYESGNFQIDLVNDNGDMFAVDADIYFEGGLEDLGGENAVVISNDVEVYITASSLITEDGEKEETISLTEEQRELTENYITEHYENV